MANKFQVDTNGTLLTSLLGYYNLDTDSLDKSINGKNGTDTLITYASGEAQFGATSNISFGNNFNFNTGAFSIAGWFKIADATTYRMALGKTASDGLADWGMRTQPTTGVVDFLVFPGPDIITGGTNCANGTYHFIVGLRDGTNLKLFVNNVSDATAVTDNLRNVSNTHNTKMGVDDGGLFQFPSGSAAKMVGIWNKALSTQEITDLYNAGAGNLMVNPSAAIGNPNLLLMGVG